MLVFAKQNKKHQVLLGHFEWKMSVRNSGGDVRKVFSFRREVQPGDVNLHLISIKVLKTMSFGRLH